MKDSGVDWIGEIPFHWESTKLKYIFFIKKDISNELGHDILSVTQNGIKIKDISKNEGQISADYSKYQLVDIDDFVMNHMDLLTGWVDCSKYQGVTSPDYRVFKLIETENYSKEFYTYLFQACYMNKIFYGLGQGVSNLGRWRLQTDKFLNFILPVLPLTEQKAIAHYLDHRCTEIENIIQNTKATIEEYKAYKQAIITEVVTKGLNSNVSMKDSGIEWIGDIPEHWKVSRFGRFIKSTMNGLTRRSNSSENTGSIVLRIKEISNGLIDYTDTNRIELTTVEKEKYTLREGDLLFVRVNGSASLVGKCAVFREIDEEVTFNDHIIKVIVEPDLNINYVHFYLQSVAGKREISKYINTAAGQFTISGDSVRSIIVTIPPTLEQQQIVDKLLQICIEIDVLISQKQQIILELEKYRKSLIYECITGKKEV